MAHLFVSSPPARLRKFRIATLVFGTSAPLWVPCAMLSMVAISHDDLYRLTIFEPSERTSLMTDYRRAAQRLEGAQMFQCYTPQHDVLTPGTRYDEHDVLLQALQSSLAAVRKRELQAQVIHYLDLIRWVDSFDLALLRRGLELARRYSDGVTPVMNFEARKIRPHCKDQDIRRMIGEPLYPPIDIHPEARAILLSAADRMDEAVAAYAEVRPWLLAFFYTWIAYSVLGFGCAIYVIWLTQPYREAIRAHRENAGMPPW